MGKRNSGNMGGFFQQENPTKLSKSIIIVERNLVSLYDTFSKVETYYKMWTLGNGRIGGGDVSGF